MSIGNPSGGGGARFVCCPSCSHQFEIDLAARLWGRVDRSAPNGCWEWLGACGGGGYGQINVDSKPRRAHRVAYELLVGPIPAGLELDHLCRNPRCVNPDHLEPVTGRENLMRAAASQAAQNAAKTHCPQGHPYDMINTRFKRGRYPARVCRECTREAARETRKAAA